LFPAGGIANGSGRDSIIEAPPYPGAKPHFLIGEELDDQRAMAELIRLTASELPLPAPKKPKPKKGKGEK